ncbi:MAG: hypothetical protein ABSA63_05660 [Thermoplasmata archaeon]|jgi:hypothetical protein
MIFAGNATVSFTLVSFSFTASKPPYRFAADSALAVPVFVNGTYSALTI